MDENIETQRELLLTWLTDQEQIHKELEALPEIDLLKAVEEAREAVRSRIKALQHSDNQPPAEGS
jgi:hypothetical protein